MTPPQRTKRQPGESASATTDQVEKAHGAPEQSIAINAGSSSATQETPRKRKATGISSSQKQALIENLQLEIAERARKLRAQYNLQAQGLRTRIEIRVNRIPMALRKTKMGDLADKHKNGQHPQLPKPTPSAFPPSASRPPPVPAKDTPGSRPRSQATSQTTTSLKRGPGRPPKRTSVQISGADKENEAESAELEQPKKRARGHPPPPADSVKASRVLSPSSSNIRALPLTTPGGKPFLSRPGLSTAAGSSSPTKQHSSSSLFSNLAEKARSTRTAATGRKQAASTSTVATSIGGSTRGSKPAAGATTTAATSNTARRVSAISESSESSTSTVDKKGSGKAAQATAKETAPSSTMKRTVMGTIRRGVAGVGKTKAAAAKSTKAPGSTASGRVLRNRG